MWVSVPNFSTLAGLEVDPTLVALGLFWVELSCVGFWQQIGEVLTFGLWCASYEQPNMLVKPMWVNLGILTEQDRGFT